jgi:hypothetical protein
LSRFGFACFTFFGSSGGLAADGWKVPSLLLRWLKSSSSEEEEDGSKFRLMAVVQDASGR